MFVDAENQDFHLQEGSPLIDAGDPSIRDPDGTVSDIGAFYFNQKDHPPVLPNENSLQFSAFPNPFNKELTIIFTTKYAPSPDFIPDVRIYNSIGKLVEILPCRLTLTGYAAMWNAEKHASGVYLATMRLNRYEYRQKVTHIR